MKLNEIIWNYLKLNEIQWNYMKLKEKNKKKYIYEIILNYIILYIKIY